ncbi:uncharacterized protein CEXT_13951 [Caerostris extrusa]|uniref:Prokineticin domain-containing protein n=1 Tax=Caerostris extrusa TaxID=172846 RepID=A0AAV4MD74_CAEEX|nr:uncharacterized protein CEXT_13951 [Caerostris extrusa]
MKGFIACFTFLFLATVIFASEYQECKNDSECGPNNCCVIGMQRFSVPWCKALGEEGSNCIVGNEAENKILWYPNGVTKNVTVYRMFCPCAESFECYHNECIPTRE